MIRDQATSECANEVASASGRCYACFRPRCACFCHSIPAIDNRTEVLILQHRRERFHPFNTARIVHRGLRNSQLLVDHTSNLATRMRLKPRAGLLYPGPTAQLLSELPIDERPEQLVILDGTWHHTKTLVRDIPLLQSLPRYCLTPSTPSRYRIRREPSAASLSTVEATVAALRILEPETEGLELLLKAFDTMVEGQLTHPGTAISHRIRKRPNRTFKNIPVALLENFENIVVAYGESPQGQRSGKRIEGPPISWVAKRLASGEAFSCLLTPPQPLDDVFLNHLALTRADFSAALSLEEARQQWARFRRPNDTVAVYLPSTARLLSYLEENRDCCLVLKSVDLTKSSLETVGDGAASSNNGMVSSKIFPGRAGLRLASAIAYVDELIALANARLQGEPALVSP
jgi:DTW domain-containing protein YfiP